jgi:hypothetical protein
MPNAARVSVQSRGSSTALFRSSSRAPHPLRIIAQKWRISFGHFDMNVVSLAARHNVQMAIVGGQVARARSALRFFRGRQRMGWRTPSRPPAPGEKVENMPDKEYGGWASQFFRSVADSGQPRFDLVTAAMQYQEEPGKPQRNVRYERLLLPWKTRGMRSSSPRARASIEKEGAEKLGAGRRGQSVIR